MNTICTESEYDAALKEIARYFVSEPALNTLEALHFGDLAESIAESISAYESEHWKIEPPREH